MSDNGMSKRTKNALISLLAGVQYDTGDGPEDAFVRVQDNMYLVGDSTPIAMVLPGDVSNQRVSTFQTERTLLYLVRITVQAEDNTDASQSQLIDQLYDLTDLVIDCLDEADQASGLSDTLGSLGTYMLTAVRGDWSEPQTNSGYALACDVNVQIVYSKSL